MKYKYNGRKVLKKFGKKWKVIGTAKDKVMASKLVSVLRMVSRIGKRN